MSTWVKGLIVAASSAAVDAVIEAVQSYLKGTPFDPAHVAAAAAVAALMVVAAYLKQSPIEAK